MALIRIADRSEAEAVMRLINAAFVVERFFIDGDRVDLAGVLRFFDTGSFLAAEDGGAAVACAYVELRGERAYLGLLSVDPARQGSGLGRALVDAAERHARDHGCHAMDLRIVNLREALPAFYRKLGYSETRIEPFPEGVATKLPCHFIVMSKAL